MEIQFLGIYKLVSYIYCNSCCLEDTLNFLKREIIYIYDRLRNDKYLGRMGEEE